MFASNSREPTEASFAYVDEYTHIGCTNCATVAPDASLWKMSMVEQEYFNSGEHRNL